MPKKKRKNKKCDLTFEEWLISLGSSEKIRKLVKKNKNGTN